MITEFFAFIAVLVENCTGVAVVETVGLKESKHMADSKQTLLEEDLSNHIEDFKSFDPQDLIFQEFDPPQHLEADPKAWKLSLPTFKRSFWDCLKTVLLIQGVVGTVTGFVAVFIVYVDFKTVEWCYDVVWNEIPKNVQHLKGTVKCVECFMLQIWDFLVLCVIFSFSLAKDLNILTLSLLAAFLDVVFRFILQMYGIFKVPWMAIPLDILFGVVLMINHYLIARHFYPHSLKMALKLHFVITSQFILAVPLWFFLVYKLFPFYIKQKGNIKIIIASCYPILTLVPKAVSRLGAQSLILKGIVRPGTAHFLVAVTYGISAIVFRVMHAGLTRIGLFVALGIAHGVIDLLERITITMREYIWEHLYRLVRRQRRPPKYHCPRSRRLIADVSIQIMLQELTALMIALGYISVYQLIYKKQKDYSSYQTITNFFVRAGIGLTIDLAFNTLSLLIQTRVINLAVNRVWRKKWRHHIAVNSLIVCLSVFFFSEHLFEIVRDKYDSFIKIHGAKPLDDVHNKVNCTFPTFFH